MKEVGRVLDMQFVYGFIPNQDSLEKYIDSKARQLAQKIVLRTNQNMKLENQGNSEEQIKQSIEELKNEIPKLLWN